jgi:hypothetical protein
VPLVRAFFGQKKRKKRSGGNATSAHPCTDGINEWLTSAAWACSPLDYYFFFGAGFVFGFSAVVLAQGSAVGLFLRPMPRVYGTVLEVLAIVLLVSSMVCLAAFAEELWIGF